MFAHFANGQENSKNKNQGFKNQTIGGTQAGEKAESSLCGDLHSHRPTRLRSVLVFIPTEDGVPTEPKTSKKTDW